MRVRAILVSFGLGLVLLGSPTLVLSQTTAVDSTATSAGGESIRGTEYEIGRPGSPVRQVGRAVLFLPYLGVELLAWPIEQLIYLGERTGIMEGVSDFLAFQLAYGNVRLGLDLQLQTGAGSAAPGIKASVGDWAAVGSELELIAGYWNKNRNQLELEAVTAPHNLRLSLVAQINNREDQPFYGLGPNSPQDRFASNRQRKIVEGTLRYWPHPKIPLATTVYFRDTDLSRPLNEMAVEDEFPRAFEMAENARYTGVEASFGFDSRDANLLATTGSLIRVLGGYNVSQLEDEDYGHYAMEVQTFLNLYHHSRVLALRVYGAGIDAEDPTRIPYIELERPGGVSGMRGYSRYRFADRTQLVLTAGYRYAVTTNVTGVFFSDWGSVARTWDKMRLADVAPSFGVGFALLGRRPIGFEIAHSPEGWQVYFGFESLFRPESRRLR